VVFKGDGQHFRHEQTEIKNNASKWSLLSCRVSSFRNPRKTLTSNMVWLEKGLWHRATNFLWMLSSFLGSVEVTEFYTFEAYLGLVYLVLNTVSAGCQGRKRNRLQFVLGPASLQIGRKCSLHVRGNGILNQVLPKVLYSMSTGYKPVTYFITVIKNLCFPCEGSNTRFACV
jgi:hypothetical protein